jgi:hypothetical protein
VNGLIRVTIDALVAELKEESREYRIDLSEPAHDWRCHVARGEAISV